MVFGGLLGRKGQKTATVIADGDGFTNSIKTLSACSLLSQHPQA